MAPLDATADICSPAHFDPFDVLSVSIAGDILSVTVEYSGGCETHAWGACWSGSWLRSLPPKATLNLSHDAMDDACDLWVSETLLIDVSSITEDAAEHYPGDTYDIAVGTQEVRVPGRD